MSLNTDDDIWSIMNDLKDELNKVDDYKEGDEEIICSCGCKEIVIDDSMQLCANCSSIIGKVIDNTAEWRFY